MGEMSPSRSATKRKPRILIETYGCTLNQAESDIMEGVLRAKGYEINDDQAEDVSDVIIINTCTVKGATENKIIERMKKLNASGKPFVVAGCLSADEGRLRSFAPNSPIVKTMSIGKICEAVDDALAGQVTVFKDYEQKDTLPRVYTAPILRIPINDGCVGHCNYCQTKIARPYLRSYSPKSISRWISEGITNGAKEIQLASQDSGAYGLDIKTDLVHLLDSICSDDSELRMRAISASGNAEFFIRLGMINPEHAVRMKEDLARILNHPNMYRFIHLPVQSGSEKVCRDMERDHTVQDFRGLAGYLREKVPDITIATDIIVGYPTESEEDFRETIELMRSVRPDIVNVSKFSPRPGTKAKMMEQLDNDTIKHRSAILSPIVREISNERNQSWAGRKLRVLITEKQKDFTGRARSYKQVVVKGFGGKLGDIVDVRISGANHGSLFGDINGKTQS